MAHLALTTYEIAVHVPLVVDLLTDPAMGAKDVDPLGGGTGLVSPPPVARRWNPGTSTWDLIPGP